MWRKAGLILTSVIVLSLCGGIAPGDTLAQVTAPEPGERCQFVSHGIEDAWQTFEDPVDDSDSWTCSG